MKDPAGVRMVFSIFHKVFVLHSRRNEAKAKRTVKRQHVMRRRSTFGLTRLHSPHKVHHVNHSIIDNLSILQLTTTVKTADKRNAASNNELNNSYGGTRENKFSGVESPSPILGNSFNEMRTMRYARSNKIIDVPSVRDVTFSAYLSLFDIGGRVGGDEEPDEEVCEDVGVGAVLDLSLGVGAVSAEKGDIVSCLIEFDKDTEDAVACKDAPEEGGEAAVESARVFGRGEFGALGLEGEGEGVVEGLKALDFEARRCFWSAPSEFSFKIGLNALDACFCVGTVSFFAEEGRKCHARVTAPKPDKRPRMDVPRTMSLERERRAREMATGARERRMVRGERSSAATDGPGEKTRRAMDCGISTVWIASRAYSENWKFSARVEAERVSVACRTRRRKRTEDSVNVHANSSLARRRRCGCWKRLRVQDSIWEEIETGSSEEESCEDDEHVALTALDPARKAEFLLDTALALIDAGKYGDDVERFLDVYLKTPNLPRTSIAKALLARANARKASGDSLLAQAHQDFQAVLRLDPSNRDVQSHIRRRTQIHFAHDPPSHRAPPEVWSRVATYIPRYHLRTWLSLSSFHRSIALHHIFHTIDLYFGEDQPENVNRSLDIFDRVKQDKSFSSRVRCLRVHWAYEEGELLDLMVRVFRTALPEFCGLREFEWIGYPELRADMVQNLLGSHPRLTSLGSIGFHFDACGISSFSSLKKLTLRAEDDDGYADWSEITTVLNNNAHTLKHLTLGAYLHRQHSWDATFLSPTIHNLTHLDLVDTRISHTVLSRIAHAAGGLGGRLESLTLHGILEEPGKAAIVFGSDEVINGEHTFLPRLKSFRFLLVGQPQVVTTPLQATPTQPQQPYYNPYQPPPPPAPPLVQPQPQTPIAQPQQAYPHPQEHYDPAILHLYQTIAHFLRGRKNLRRLDLGSCPWDVLGPVLPGLTGLRVVGVRIGCLARGCSASTSTIGANANANGDFLGGCMSEVDVLVKSLPREVGALRVEVGVSELPLHVYAGQFQKFTSLAFLHLVLHSAQPAYHPPAPASAPLPVLPLQIGGPQQAQGYVMHNTQYYAYQQPQQQQQPQQPQQQQQQQQQRVQQPSYHPFPPHPAHHHQATVSSTGGAQPGTPKRRNGGASAGSGSGAGAASGSTSGAVVGKKDGEHEGEADDTATASSTTASGSGSGPNSAEAGPSQAQVQGQGNTQMMGPPPVPRQPVLGYNTYPVYAPQVLQQQQQQQQPLMAPAPLGTLESARHVAGVVGSLDFVGWNGELYVIVRSGSGVGGSKVDAGVETRGAGSGVSRSSMSVSASPVLGGDGNGNGERRTPTPASVSTPAPGPGPSASGSVSSTPTPTPVVAPVNAGVVASGASVELKELPSRRRLDCGNGVDLGSEDATWLERKDVPMDYDMPVTGVEGGAV
ncbi:hypothetical protein P691DRAFT_790625 [Macrolepiota fuliginosa MF-IS2]|uniref:Uncharacterized protein n=1 Tax=Macrolepiota fuliginosa MF-IS2 TaxID=1400762 RepID=A0A9P6C5C9_9AGAR|nr:hypothetical protein P691DRAFT_790625 [Macrolepiota fuliginosa MF-IS2]